MPTMTIYRGLPGSGKSHRARQRARDGRTAWCSADHYFHLRRRDGGADRAEGRHGIDAVLAATGGHPYDFNVGELVFAHGYCFRTAIAAVERGFDVAVDNTATSVVELAPYVALAQAHGYDVEIIHVDTPVDVCLTRQTHGVPEAALRAMAARFERSLPPWWPAQTVVQG